MGWNDHMGKLDSCENQVQCRCGAKYSIYEDDGVPGCREIETVNCQFCGAELARHFGTCDGRLIDDSDVSEMLKTARKECDDAVEAYTQKHGYNWDAKEYYEILEKWRDAVKKILEIPNEEKEEVTRRNRHYPTEGEPEWLNLFHMI